MPVTNSPPNDCFALTDVSGLDRGELQDFLGIDQAWELIARQVTPVIETERLAVNQALGRVLAEPVVAAADVPPRANAAVDGYAFRHQDLAGGAKLPVSVTLHAGDPIPVDLAPGTVARALTGALLPENADTVAMEEDCERSGDAVSGGAVSGDAVRLPLTIKIGSNRRPQGENVAKGATSLAPGQVIRAQEIALALIAGAREVRVRRKLRVVVLSTGDELADGTPEEHQTLDSNGPMLEALLASGSVDVERPAPLPDDGDAVTKALKDYAKRADLIVTTGGASMSESDWIRRTLISEGSAHIWRLAIKPGRPLTMGQIDGCLLAALPGNPVAAYVTGQIIVKPLLSALSGATDIAPKFSLVTAGFERRSKRGRAEFLRARLVAGAALPTAEVYHKDGAGIVPSLTFADGLVWVDQDAEGVRTGDLVRWLAL